jgi:hypothetical protein
MVRGPFITAMAIYIGDSSTRIWQMVMGFISIRVATGMKGHGKAISKMDRARRCWRMAACSRVVTKTARSRVMVLLNGLMGRFMLAIGKTIILKAKVNTPGQTGEFT